MSERSPEKYLELNRIMRQNQTEWSQYEKQSSSHFDRIRKDLINYLGCTNQQVRWLVFPDDFEATGGVLQRRISVARKMVLFYDNFWRVIFRISLEVGSLDFLLKLRRVDGYFLLIIGADAEVKIYKKDLNDLTYVSEMIFQHIAEYVGDEFKRFIRMKPSKRDLKPTIGYPMIVETIKAKEE